jgi:hypothetical protein
MRSRALIGRPLADASRATLMPCAAATAVSESPGRTV